MTSSESALDSDEALIDLFKEVYAQEWDIAANQALLEFFQQEPARKSDPTENYAEDRVKEFLDPAERHATLMGIRAVIASHRKALLSDIGGMA